MASLKDGFSIEKLTQSNYSTWKFKIEMLLIKEDLFDLIEQEQPVQPTIDWVKKDKKARALINLSIDDSQIINIKNETTAKSTWDTLKRIHERSNLSSKLYLLRKLYGMKLDEGGDLTTHITKLLEMIDKLKSIGEEIKDSHISALMLCSLPKSYDGLITALEARPEEELNSDFIRSKLTDEYIRRKESSNSAEPATRAYKTYSQQNRFKKINKYCQNCNLKNHNTAECWHTQKNLSQKRNNFKNQQYNKIKNNSSLAQERSKQENPEYPRRENYGTPTNITKHFTFFTNANVIDSWIIDSGSSSHVCNDKNKFTKFDNYKTSSVMIANGKTLQSHGSGSVKLKTIISEGKTENITLEEVLYVPEIETNLISVKKATEKGCVAIFENNSCKIKFQGKTYLEGYINDNLYEANIDNNSVESARTVKSCTNENCIKIWHKRLGHKNNKQIRELITNELATGIKLDKCVHDEKCENCIISKLSDAPYPKQAEFRATYPTQLVHTDLCGPMQTPTIGGKHYFLTFVDDFSRFTIIYLLRNKDEAFGKFKEYLAMTTNKFQRKVQTIRSDRGGEYTGTEFENYLIEQGIEHQLSVAYCPSQNGVAERKNRTLVEMTRCLLNQANLPHKFWGEAINTAAYLQNRLPTTACDTTPYEKWTGRKPDFSHIKTFGCKAYAYINKNKRGKLDDKAQEGILVGYDNRSKGYRIYTGGKNITISRTVKFIENIQPKEQNKQNSINDQIIAQENTTQNNSTKKESNTLNIEVSTEEKIETSDDVELSDQPRRSERSNKGVPPDRLIYYTNHNRIIEPKSWEEINSMKNSHDKQNWIAATKEEINSLKENETWDLVDPPPGKKVIGCKWAFKAKYNNSGKIEKYKARLVAKGFSQKYGIDYEETFAPVVSHTTIRAFLNMALYKNLHLRHIDIKTAFLHGNLEEEVYMSQPEGYIKQGEENKVCKLKKAIYGLKQSARAWNIKISETVTKLGFKQCLADKCLYKQTENGNTTYIIVYVDDIIIAGNEKNINKIIAELNKEYKTTDLGDLSYYLNINIEKPEDGVITLDQKNKIEELIIKFNLTDAKPCDTPMEPGYYKSNDESTPLPNNTKYRQAIGALLYISTITRPDIAAAVNILSRKNEKPTTKDWEAVKRVMKYLKYTKNLKFVIDNKSKPILTAYADSDWASDKSDRKSTTGNIFKLGNNPINWLVKKQVTVSVSSAEAEYISAASACQEVLWLLNLLNELDLPQKLPITLFEDNISCIKLAESDKLHTRTKHIDVRHHLIRDLTQQGTIELSYLPSSEMTADVLTKPLPKPDFQRHRRCLQLKDFHHP